MRVNVLDNIPPIVTNLPSPAVEVNENTPVDQPIFSVIANDPDLLRGVSVEATFLHKLTRVAQW